MTDVVHSSAGHGQHLCSDPQDCDDNVANGNWAGRRESSVAWEVNRVTHKRKNIRHYASLRAQPHVSMAGREGV